MTASSINVAAPRGWVQAWRSRGSAWPLAMSPMIIKAMAAFASGGEIITLHAAATVDQRATSIQRDSRDAPAGDSPIEVMPMTTQRQS